MGQALRSGRGPFSLSHLGVSSLPPQELLLECGAGLGGAGLQGRKDRPRAGLETGQAANVTPPSPAHPAQAWKKVTRDEAKYTSSGRRKGLQPSDHQGRVRGFTLQDHPGQVGGEQGGPAPFCTLPTQHLPRSGPVREDSRWQQTQAGGEPGDPGTGSRQAVSLGLRSRCP